MKYAYHDLGNQGAGTVALVRWRGAPADVFLLNSVNFFKYREGANFTYSSGGHFRRSPARVPIPADGHWFVVIDFHRHSEGLAATVEVITPAKEGSPRETLVAGD